MYALARRCSGGVIMGFGQYRITRGTRKAGTRAELRIDGKPVRIPSAWNQIKAGLLFGLGLPLLVFREEEWWVVFSTNTHPIPSCTSCLYPMETA